MTCASCDSELVDVEIKGDRMLLSGESASRPVQTQRCTTCGLILFWDPRFRR